MFVKNAQSCDLKNLGRIVVDRPERDVNVRQTLAQGIFEIEPQSRVEDVAHQTFKGQNSR